VVLELYYWSWWLNGLGSGLRLFLSCSWRIRVGLGGGLRFIGSFDMLLTVSGRDGLGGKIVGSPVLQ
jgi:hypothetical protein